MRHTVKLNDAFKGFTLDQDKIFSPGETVKRFYKKLEKLDLDIMEKAVRIDNGRLDIPVYFSLCGKDATAMTGTKKQMGKGATPIQAQASAVMELAERFSFFSFCKNTQNFFTDTFRNVKDKALGFEMIAQSVHDTSGDLDAAKKIFEELPLQWTQAFNLTRNQPVLIPFDWFFTINEFNGPSAGNCVEEALSQGICEIVERHVSSLVSHNRLNVPAIRPDSATDPMVKEMLGKYRHAGIELFVSDFSLDTGIPSVGVMAYDPATFPKTSEIVWTAGTTPDPQKAFSRALTEVAQLAGDFNTSSNYVASGLPKFRTLEEAGHIIHPKREIDITALPDLSDDNIKIEVENCIAALKARGMEVIVINTMHPLLEIPAFYTIIPGAHFRERSLGTSVGLFCCKLITEKNAPADAISRLKRVEQTLPGKYYIKFYLGSCHLSMGAHEKALACFKQALDMDPHPQDIPSIHSYMGVCLKEMGRYREALAVLTAGEKFDSERTDIYNLMGFCHFMLKEHRHAIENFEKVLFLDPSSAIDYANIGSNYREMGETEKAVHYYQTALELDPGIDFARDSLEKLKNSAASTDSNEAD